MTGSRRNAVLLLFVCAVLLGVVRVSSAQDQSAWPVPKRKPLPPHTISGQVEFTQVQDTPPASQNTEKKGVFFSMTLTPKQVILSDTQKENLTQHVTSYLNKNAELSVVIHAYATLELGVKNSDTRLALARALAVRKFLMAEGIAPSRIKINAWGEGHDGGDNNRIDITIEDVISKNIAP